MVIKRRNAERRSNGLFPRLNVPLRPSRPSFEGSLTAVEAMCTTMLKAARSRNPTDLSQVPIAAVQTEAARLGAARVRLDVKAQPVADALLVYADVAKAWNERPPSNASQQGERFRSLSAAAKQILTEIAKAKPAA